MTFLSVPNNSIILRPTESFRDLRDERQHICMHRVRRDGWLTSCLGMSIYELETRIQTQTDRPILILTAASSSQKRETILMLRRSSRLVSVRAKHSCTCSTRSRIHSGVPNVSNGATNRQLNRVTLFTAGAAATLLYCYSSSPSVFNDADVKTAAGKEAKESQIGTELLFDDEHLLAVAWGSNK